MSFILGEKTTPQTGNITTLQWIKPGYDAETEDALGFERGRLSMGYWILLLTSVPDPNAFEFAGTTLRSGGREGLPAKDWSLDAQRPRVHDQMQSKHGKDGYRALQLAALRRAAITGPERLARVVPEIRHDDNIMPDRQYPMGGGGLQWVIRKPGLSFLAAAWIAPDQRANIPNEAIDLRKGYEARATLRQYLISA